MKKMNSEESLALIEKMVNATRQKYEKGAGSAFLIWGYTSFLISLIVYVLRFCYNIEWASWLWFLIPIVGTFLMLFRSKSEERVVTTHIDKFIKYTWIVTGIVGTLIPIVSIFAKQWIMVLPMESLILSIATTITGLTIGLRYITVGGALSILLALCMLFAGVFNHQVILFMVMFLVAMIIPGHILICKKRCSKS